MRFKELLLVLFTVLFTSVSFGAEFIVPNDYPTDRHPVTFETYATEDGQEIDGWEVHSQKGDTPSHYFFPNRSQIDVDYKSWLQLFYMKNAELSSAKDVKDFFENLPAGVVWFIPKNDLHAKTVVETTALPLTQNAIDTQIPGNVIGLGENNLVNIGGTIDTSVTDNLKTEITSLRSQMASLKTAITAQDERFNTVKVAYEENVMSVTSSLDQSNKERNILLLLVGMFILLLIIILIISAYFISRLMRKRDQLIDENHQVLADNAKNIIDQEDFGAVQRKLEDLTQSHNELVKHCAELEVTGADVSPPIIMHDDDLDRQSLKELGLRSGQTIAYVLPEDLSKSFGKKVLFLTVTVNPTDSEDLYVETQYIGQSFALYNIKKMLNNNTKHIQKALGIVEDSPSKFKVVSN